MILANVILWQRQL